MALRRLIFLLFLFSSSIKQLWALTKAQEADRISSLPDQPPVNFSQFSGYITVNEEQGRALFYWLTEATNLPNEKPLILWLSGGPGCSSIAYGASEEIGPFRINKSGSSLFLNNYSWNKLANILFLESPAGVGFSYTNTTSNLKDTGDKRTARENLIFLIRWMARFPQYRNRDFFIAGESYAGHYVPQLANLIHDYNKIASRPFINLKGFIVGNGVMDNYYDGIGTVAYWWSHSIISDKTYKQITEYCDYKPGHTSKKCDDAVNYAYNHEFGNIDQYSIYTPACIASDAKIKASRRFQNTLFIPRFSGGYDPCIENFAPQYYNSPEVQKAMHANTTNIPYPWAVCNDVLFYNWKDSALSVLPLYKKMIDAGLRIWVYSGDTDSVVPITGTRFSLSHLNLKIKIPWYPWYSGSQVGGWSEVYDGLTFATVRGAGHEVPLFQPERAFILFKTFLSGKNLPTS